MLIINYIIIINIYLLILIYNIKKGEVLTSIEQDVLQSVDTKFYIPNTITTYSKFFIHIIIYFQDSNSYKVFLKINNTSVLDSMWIGQDINYMQLSTNLYNNIYHNGHSNMENNYFTINMATTQSASTQKIKFIFGIFT